MVLYPEHLKISPLAFEAIYIMKRKLLLPSILVEYIAIRQYVKYNINVKFCRSVVYWYVKQDAYWKT